VEKRGDAQERATYAHDAVVAQVREAGARFDAVVRDGRYRRLTRPTHSEAARAITVIAAAGLERVTKSDAAQGLYAAYSGGLAVATT